VAADGQTPQPWSYLDALGTLTRVGFERSDTSLARDPIAHGDPYHRRVSPREFRDHWADTQPDWSHGGTWLTSFVLPPKVVGDTVFLRLGTWICRFWRRSPRPECTSPGNVCHGFQMRSSRNCHVCLRPSDGSSLRSTPSTQALAEPVVGSGVCISMYRLRTASPPSRMASDEE
jgi:hypothetical protein